MLSIGRLGTTRRGRLLPRQGRQQRRRLLPRSGRRRRGNGSERPPSSSGSSARSTPGRSRNLLAGTSAAGDEPGRQALRGTTSRLRPDVLRPQGRLAALGLRARARSATRSPPPTTGRSAPCSTTSPPRPATPAGAPAAPADRSQRVHRRRVPAPHQPGRRPPAPHPCRRPQPGPGRRRPVVRPRRPAPLRLEDDRRHPLPSALRAELAPLGLAWDIRRNGLSELRDIPKAVLRAFSKRRVDIEAAMDKRGSHLGHRQPRDRALATRERKPAGRRRPTCCAKAGRSSWPTIELPDGAGWHRGRPASTTSPPPSATNVADHPDPRMSRRSSGSWPARTACRSTTGRSTSTSLHRAPAGGTARHPARIDLHPTGCHQRRGQGVRRHPRRGAGVSRPNSSTGTASSGSSPTPMPAPTHVRTRSGHIVPATSGDRRYTTTELLAAEQRIIRSATRPHRRRNRPGRPRHRRTRPRTPSPSRSASRPTVCGHCSPRATATTW